MNTVNAKTKLLALFANPHDHSRSPELYNNAFRKLDINAIYMSFKVNEKNLEDTVKAYRALDFLGANVSMPNKVAIMPYLDKLDKSAELVGAVNCLVNDNGNIVGYNTDGIGFTNSLKNNDVVLEDSCVTLIGVGGAGTAIAASLCLEGVKKIHIFNIKDASYEQGKKLVERLNSQTKTAVSISDLNDETLLKMAIQSSEILINATSMGMEPHEGKMALPNASFIKENMVVADTIYNPEETELLKNAKLKGCKIVNGEGMLIEQAKINFKMWTNKDLEI